MGDDHTTNHTIGVTGATGALGGRVAARIARLGRPQRLIVRDINRAPEYPGSSAAMAAYEDSTGFERACRGWTRCSWSRPPSPRTGSTST